MHQHTVRVHISAGEPTEVELCPRCLHATLAVVRLTGVLHSGVMPMGSIRACARCDSLADVVARYVASEFRPEAGSAP